MNIEQEVELKLAVARSDVPRLAAASMLAGATPIDRHQVSTYFDTPDRHLRKAGLSLRVRRVGDRFVQTVKAEGTATAGLFARPEWEKDVPGDEPVLDAEAGPIRMLVPEAALATLAPVFSIDVQRRIVTLDHQNSRIEVSIDQGQIEADDRVVPLAEIELELLDGPSPPLFALARTLDDLVPLRLGVQSKSERGYMLLDSDGSPVKADVAAIAADATAGEAFQGIAAACLRHFRLNEDLLAVGRNGEALHQARVALRRLRSALSIFRPMLADDRFDALRDGLRTLAATLGEARDLDVLLPRLEGALAERVAQAREEAYRAVEETLASPDTRRLLIDLSEWIAIGSWRTDSADNELRDQLARDFATTTLTKLRRQIKRRGRGLAGLDDEERHEVRILAKKLRYAAEFFSGLYQSDKAVRRQRKFLKPLERLQGHLGELNDMAHAPVVLARLGITDEQPAPGKTRRAALIDRAADAYRDLVDAKRFWR